VPRPDTGNFNKFLTSLGLLLLGAAVVIPYFYFRNTEVLSFSVADLDEMTPAGRSAILARQHAIATLELWVVIGAGLIGVTGLVLLVMGALRLRAAQRWEDEESDLRRSRARLEYEEMSPEEQKEKNAAQAVVEVEGERSGVVEVGRRSAAGGPEPQKVEITTLDSWRQRADLIARLSAEIEKTFRERDVGPYELKWQVRIGSQNDEIRLDGVFERKDARPKDVVLRIRVAADPTFLAKSARNTANELIATLERYRVLTGRPANGWIVAVVPKESATVPAAESFNAIESMRRALGPWGEVTLIDEDEIGDLPNVFADIFISS
jgi:hypothetical protein